MVSFMCASLRSAAFRFLSVLRCWLASSIFPERMRVAELAQGLADLEHRGVGGQDVERLAWRGRFEGLHYGLLEVGDDGSHGEVCVLEANGHVLGAEAGDHERGGALGPALNAGFCEHLEVHVPEPRD